MEANTCSDARASSTVSAVWSHYKRQASVDAATLRSYDSLFTRHVEPHLGGAEVAAVGPQDVQEVVRRVTAAGLSPTTARLCWVVMSVLCRHAVGLGLVDRPATSGVPMPKASTSPVRVMTPEEYLQLREHLPTPGSRLLADVLVRSGLRLGEAFALEVADIADEHLLVRRCLSEPGRRMSSDGRRFVLRPTTKNGSAREVLVGHALVRRLRAWCRANGLSGRELVFPAALVVPAPTGRPFPAKVHLVPLTPERLAELGTFSGPNGLTYQHGTVNGYVTGLCREACCRQAVSEYSAMRRKARNAAAGRSRRPAAVGSTAPVADRGLQPLGAVEPKAWSRVWKEAASAADLGFSPQARHTRHAHASWLNGHGVSAEVIAERLGHLDERSTRRYVRPVGSEPGCVEVLDDLVGDVEGTPERTPAHDL